MLDKNLITVVVYHIYCSDGVSSKYVCKKYFENNNIVNVEYIGEHPSKNGELSWSKVLNLKNQKILFTDIAPSYEIYNILKNNNNEILILDHHKSNIDDLQNILEDEKIFRLDKSGVGITWEYFNSNKEIPYILKLVEKRDLWLKDDKNSEYFYELTKTMAVENEDELFNFYDKCIEDDIFFKTNIEKSKSIVEYKNKDYMLISKKPNIILEIFDEDKLLVSASKNTDHDKSDLCNIMVKSNNCDFSYGWTYFTSYNCTGISLRSLDSKSDVQEIAKLYNGGGHRNAAGISINGFKSILADKFICLNLELWNSINFILLNNYSNKKMRFYLTEEKLEENKKNVDNYDNYDNIVFNYDKLILHNNISIQEDRLKYIVKYFKMKNYDIEFI